MLALGGGTAGYAYYEHLNGNIKKDELNLGTHGVAKAAPNAEGQTPMNILLLGSDDRNNAGNLKLGGAKKEVGWAALADVQMLLHLSADRKNMSVVSLPRDTMIPLPECTDPKTKKTYPAEDLDMANASLAHGGPCCSVATWEALTRTHIDHFLMVDFTGVVSMADAIGGVPVCVKENAYSHTPDGHGSGLRLKAGTTSVKGEQALQWLRTRYGFEDGTDLGRTHAQHMYMTSMVRELCENATLTNPGRMRSLAETATKALTVDDRLDTVKKLYDLSNELRKVPSKHIAMTTLPTAQWSEDHNRLVPKPGDAEALLSLVRKDQALDGSGGAGPAPRKTPAPAHPAASLGIQVLNASGTGAEAPVRGRAGQVVARLKTKGYTRAEINAQRTPGQETAVLFPASVPKADAQAAGKALGIPADLLRKSADVSRLTILVGTDWREDTAYPAEKQPKKAPDSAAVLNGEDKGACMPVQPGFTW
ncbi:LCP family protein [Streptomyces sp. SPB074]|uniref:LCP family protein n=1 Tax=Streptomyces sp. (strain SPB074) TaxID=465543 RepID=UPI0002E9B1F6